MLLRDSIYGDTEVATEVIIELVNSKPMQRLKGIAQFGVPDEFFYVPNYSRFDHSVGVMLLLKKLGASEEEQIAGLLHDVSHTAFSHMIDWVIDEGGAESFQDDHHEEYILRTDLPDILKKHGYTVERITDYHHFGLLERDTPELCADRVDYSLREFPPEVAKQCVSALTAADGRIAFTNEADALLFARNFLELQTLRWGGFESLSRYRLFADVLRMAVQDKIVTLDDFWQDDEFVMNKVKQSENKQIQQLLHILRNKSLEHLDKSDTRVFKKFRHVNPHFLKEGRLLQLCDVNDAFAAELEAARQQNTEGILIPVIA